MPFVQIMATAEQILSAPRQPLPLAKECLTQEEVADTTKLPFVAASGDAQTDASMVMYKRH